MFLRNGGNGAREGRARKPFFSSAEFWLGVATVFFSIIIAYGTALMFIG
jgi:hypothetical protein